MKRTIRLNESELKRMIAKSVKRVLNESYLDKEYTYLLSSHGGYANNGKNYPYQHGKGNIYSHVSIDDVEWVAPNKDAAYGYLKAIYGRGSDIFGEHTRNNFFDDIMDIEFDKCALLKDGAVIIFKDDAELGRGDKEEVEKSQKHENNYYNYNNGYQPVMNAKNHMSSNNDDFYFTKNSNYADKMRDTIYK